MRFLSIVLILGWALLLTGCVGLSDYKLYRTNHTSAYSNHNFAHFNQNNDLLTVIHGNPTDAPKAKFDEAVTSAMQGRNAHGRTNFTTTPNETNDPRTKFVIQFNPSISKTARDLCIKETPLPTGQPVAGKITMIMAYCVNSRYLAYTFGETAQPNSPNDPAFAAMIGGAVQKLIPLADPDRGSICRRNC